MSALDRDAARAVLLAEWPMGGVDEVLDALEGCVRPAPQTLDRAALITLLLDRLRGTTVPAIPLADDVLALLRTVDGVTLTRAEVSTVMWLVGAYEGRYGGALPSRVAALVTRLEAAP